LPRGAALRGLPRGAAFQRFSVSVFAFEISASAFPRTLAALRHIVSKIRTDLFMTVQEILDEHIAKKLA